MPRIRQHTLFGLLVLVVPGCGYGPKVEKGNVEVYYLDGTTQDQAERLAAHMAKDGVQHRRSVQLKKTPEGIYQFRMVVKKEFQNDEPTQRRLAFDGARISRDVLGGAAVEVHVCDEHLKTLKTIPPRPDVRHGILENKVGVFFATEAEREDAQRLAKHLAGLLGQTPGDFKLVKREKLHEVHMVTKPEVLNDPTWIAGMRQDMANFSTQVFGGAPVEVHLCDELMDVVKVLK